MSTIVITGASQGIGRAIALRFAAADGVKIALVARNKSKLAAVAKACSDEGATVEVYPCELTDPLAVERLGSKVIEELGIPDLLVNNAGMFLPGSLLETTAEDFKKQVDVNLNSAFYVTRAFLPSMIDQKKGSIHFMASVASTKAYPGGGAYCASKHGLLGLARVVREETREHGIRTVIFMPGATRTASWDGTDLPDSRFISPVDIADMVWSTYSLSPQTVVEEVIIRPQLGDI